MAKDDRLYARFTLDFADHPKIVPLSDAAFRAYVEMVLYSKRLLTDGFIASALANARWGAMVCQELASNDPQNPSLIEVPGGYKIHDFEAHQTTKAEIETLREKRKLAGQKGGVARAKALAKQVPKQNRGKSKPETETKIDITPLSTDVDISPSPGKPAGSPSKPGYPAAFEAFWAAYPRRTGKRKALEAWKRAKGRGGEQAVLDGAKRLASDPNLPESQFIPHPATWLNRDGWEDEPLPARNSPEQQKHDRVWGTRPEDWDGPAAQESSPQPALTWPDNPRYRKGITNGG